MLKTRSSRRDEGEIVTGMKVLKTSTNSPAKAWRLIMTTTILEKIVEYSNDYGKLSIGTGSFTEISQSDIIDFICVLFVSSIQKRKDKVANWWSDNPLKENPVVKQIMTGRQFSHVLRFLHVADVCNQPSKDADDYNPAYKVQEFMDLLEARFSAYYTPSQNLSLDESIIRAFGFIKFKVCIVTESARYGIKLYVLTDALNAYVLKVIVYTGASTYYNSGPEDTKKTVMVVKQSVDKYKNTHRTIYAD
jgi:Transposase IS4